MEACQDYIKVCNVVQPGRLRVPLLPLATPTRIYMTGSVRSWIHYIDLRSAHGTQKEHMDIAHACKTVFIEQFPIVSEALEWRNGVVEIQKQIKKELHGEET